MKEWHFYVLLFVQLITLGCLFVWTARIYCAVQGRVC